MPVVDTFPPAPLPLSITFHGHATLSLSYGDTVIHVDPVGQFGDFSRQPPAHVILVTHEHHDHLDTAAIDAVRTPETTIVATRSCADKLPDAVVLHNGDSRSIRGIRIEAVPAYNIKHMHAPGSPYHPRGVGNGYVLTLGDLRVYVAGDTENIPEMKSLHGIDIAFLPMNLPYTMTPEMTAEAARMFHPKILYPYHTGDTDTAALVDILKGEKDIEVRIRPMK
jgi:L-ascorbate metabolism protein UlaG (beta-lactamase superfamily)